MIDALVSFIDTVARGYIWFFFGPPTELHWDFEVPAEGNRPSIRLRGSRLIETRWRARRMARELSKDYGPGSHWIRQAGKASDNG